MFNEKCYFISIILIVKIIGWILFNICIFKWNICKCNSNEKYKMIIKIIGNLCIFENFYSVLWERIILD